MGHWFLSNIPWKSLAVYTVISLAILCFKGPEDYGFLAFTFIGILLFLISIVVIFIRLDNHFEMIIRNSIVPEFMDKRPFREFDVVRKEVILQKILVDVNNSVNFKLKTNYSFTNTIDLVSQYNECMNKFANQLDKLYAGVPDEKIVGWHKIMLMAKNMAEEDMEYALNTAYSNELIQKYGTRNATPKKIIDKQESNLSKSSLNQETS